LGFIGLRLTQKVIGARGAYVMPIKITLSGPPRLIPAARAFMGSINRMKEVDVVSYPQEPSGAGSATGKQPAVAMSVRHATAALLLYTARRLVSFRIHRMLLLLLLMLFMS
jgi:hypothetical protein